MLRDGELESVFENRPGTLSVVQSQQTFAELDVDGHPVGLLRAQSAQMLDGVGAVARIEVCLGKVEPR